MGQEIAHSHFTESDFIEFRKRMREETKILMGWFKKDGMTPVHEWEL